MSARLKVQVDAFHRRYDSDLEVAIRGLQAVPPEQKFHLDHGCDEATEVAPGVYVTQWWGNSDWGGTDFFYIHDMLRQLQEAVNADNPQKIGVRSPNTGEPLYSTATEFLRLLRQEAIPKLDGAVKEIAARHKDGSALTPEEQSIVDAQVVLNDRLIPGWSEDESLENLTTALARTRDRIDAAAARQQQQRQSDEAQTVDSTYRSLIDQSRQRLNPDTPARP